MTTRRAGGAAPDGETVSRLLAAAGRESSDTPLDRLLEALTRSSDPPFIEATLAAEPFSTWVARPDDWLDPQLPLSTLEALKRESKRRLDRRAATDPEDAVRGAWGYYLAVALAATAHGARLSSLEPSRLARELRDLASVLDLPWSDRFERAAEEVSRPES